MKSALDKYSSEAAALLEFLQARPLFSERFGSGDAQSECTIHDAKKAWNYCSSQILPAKFEYWTGLREANGLDPLPRREKLTENMKNRLKLYEMADYFQGEVYTLAVKQGKPFGLGKDEAGSISEDFAVLLNMRAFRTTPHKWAEKLFDIYQRGGWPCGWEGKYPQGRIIVFVPK